MWYYVIVFQMATYFINESFTIMLYQWRFPKMGYLKYSYGGFLKWGTPVPSNHPVVMDDHGLVLKSMVIWGSPWSCCSQVPNMPSRMIPSYIDYSNHSVFHTLNHFYTRTYATYIHTSIHPYMHTCIHAGIHAYIHACIHPSIHTYILCIYIYTCEDLKNAAYTCANAQSLHILHKIMQVCLLLWGL